MKIYAMTATFGKLEHATLTLRPGLNIIQAPNEWGKSTWCAFLAAMLYGIDSRAHSITRQGLADKSRYEPWSGQPMSGRIELNWKGRDITIERSSTRRGAFRQFRAYETHTGVTVGELTGENCGQMLLGVEKDVFLRAGFIRFSDMPVTQSQALRRRLNALVTTADESGAADRLAAQLNKLKNECRANRSHGLLPQAQAQQEALLEKMERLTALRAESEKLAAQQHLQEQEYQTLQSEQAFLIQSAEHSRTETLSQLQKLRQDRAHTEAQRRALQAPPIPQPFQGLSSEDGLRMARTDCLMYQQARRPSLPRLALALLPAALTLPCLLIPHWIGWCICLAGVVSGMALFSLERSRQIRAAASAEALLKKYDGAPPEQWEQRVLSLLTQQAEYETRLDQYRRTLDALDETIAQLEQSLHYGPDQDDTARKIRDCEQQLRQIHLQQGRCQGQIEALGDEKLLQSQLGELEKRIHALKQTLDALELAQQTLAKATAQLQSRFAPRITKRASALFSRLTGGRYQRIFLTEELSPHTCTEQEDTLRSILWRSDGTTDQLYLAVRLAVAAELTPHAPLVLDDALIRFDQTRLKAAMDVLQEEATEKQVILFTCQDREANTI